VKSFKIVGILILILGNVSCASPPEALLPPTKSHDSSPSTQLITRQPTKTTVPASPTVLPTNTPYPTSIPQSHTISVCAAGCDFTSIQMAIDDSSTMSGDIIGVLDEVHTEAGILVTKSIIIQGSGSGMTIVQADEKTDQATERVFTIPENVRVTLKNLTIQKGHPAQAPYSGGGIHNLGDLIVENCLIWKNTAGDGGGIFNRGNLLIINSTISHNHSDSEGDPGIECGSGGGINNGATLTIHNSLIKSNTALGKGGGLHIACKGIVSIVNSEISDNKSTRNGGGVFLKGTLTLVDSLITRNSTPADGGGIIIYGTLYYIDTVISGNLSGGNCIIWGEGTYRGTGEVGLENNTRVPENNCRPK